MSEAPLRVGLVAEGPTDAIVIEAALGSILGGRPFVLTQLQPESSVGFGQAGTGWSGVYRWCKQVVARSGRLSSDRLLFGHFHAVIIHLDADVAAEVYSAAGITPAATDQGLPCQRPCPPPDDTVDALRGVALSWCGETTNPANTVFCLPSKSTEAWVVAALIPTDAAFAAYPCFECHPEPAARLSQQPKASRFRKSVRDYRQRAEALRRAWPAVASRLSAAGRFRDEVLATLGGRR